MSDNELTLGTRISKLETQLAELKSQLVQMKRRVVQNNRMIIWQIIIFALAMVGTLLGTIAWLSTSSR